MVFTTGTEFVIEGLKESKISAKLIAMGILPGSKIRIIRKAPFGKVYFVQVDQSRYALREEELNSIVLSK